ncbi:MAG: hypothetical protein CMB80_05455 [Flammeovirgaceae bacterium]|nr:hypothetical protein [Flammeovirgaceae bacterium]
MITFSKTGKRELSYNERENKTCLIPLGQFYKRAGNANVKKQEVFTSPWYTYVDMDSIGGSLRTLIETGFFLPDSEIIGYKDVGYRFMSPQLIQDFLHMLNKLYDLRIVFNFRRDKQALINSMIRAQMIDGRMSDLEAVQHFEALENLDCPYPNFRIDYEDLFLFKRLEALFEFCGLDYDKEKCKALFKVPHSNNYRPGRFKNEATNE